MTLARLLPVVEQHERARFHLAALAFMCVAASALIARAAGDSLFLSQVGSHALPFMYVAGAMVTGIGAYACARAAARVRTARLAITVAIVLIAGNAAVLLTLSVLPAGARGTAYLLADVTGRVLMILYWATAGEVFDARESRRLFGLIGAFGTAACLPAGLLVGPIARQYGISSLLLLVCLLLSGFVFATWRLELHETETGGSRDHRGTVPNRDSANQLHRRKQFVSIVALAVTTAVVQTLVDYHFKSSYSAQLSGTALAAVFGRLYAQASVAALILQLFLVHRILKWGGVLASLSLLPAGLMAASAVVLQTGSSSWIYLTKALDVTFTLTVNGTARQMLYRGIPSESRVQARSMAEGLYQPLAIALAGSALALTVQSLTIQMMAAITVTGAFVWILVARAAYAAYVAGLIESLRATRFTAGDGAFAGSEPAVRKYVLNAIASASGERVKYLAAVVPDVLVREGQTDAEVRWTLVRSAAAGEFAAPDAWLRAQLTDPHPRVRAFAAAALINSGVPAAARTGRATLEALVSSSAPCDRRAAAEGIGEARGAGFTPLLEVLLRTEEESVLEAALDACITHPSPELIAAVLPRLSRRRLAADACDALVAIGAAAVMPAARYVRSVPPERRGEIVKKLARAIARGRSVTALALLRSMPRLVPADDRAPVLQAYVDLLRMREAAPANMDGVEALILAEARQAMAHVRVLAELSPSPATALLRMVLRHLVDAHVRNVFLLLDARIAQVNMLTLHAAFSGGTREGRSQVVELLHNIVPEALQEPMLEVLAGVEVQPVEELTDARPAIAGLLAHPNSVWVTAGALHAASRVPVTSRRRQMRVLLGHPHPVVRETALAALARVERRATLVNECLPLTADSDDNVRETARTLIAGT